MILFLRLVTDVLIHHRSQSYPEFFMYITPQYSTTENSTTASKNFNILQLPAKTARTGNLGYGIPSIGIWKVLLSDYASSASLLFMYFSSVLY